VIDEANRLAKIGIKSKDALHVACSIKARCDLFITTDDILLKKLDKYTGITVINPLQYISRG